MEMRYWWLLNCEAQDIFAFHYHPGLENLGDYPSNTTLPTSIAMSGRITYNKTIHLRICPGL